MHTIPSTNSVAHLNSKIPHWTQICAPFSLLFTTVLISCGSILMRLFDTNDVRSSFVRNRPDRIVPLASKWARPCLSNSQIPVKMRRVNYVQEIAGRKSFSINLTYCWLPTPIHAIVWMFYMIGEMIVSLGASSTCRLASHWQRASQTIQPSDISLPSGGVFVWKCHLT